MILSRREGMVFDEAVVGKEMDEWIGSNRLPEINQNDVDLRSNTN